MAAQSCAAMQSRLPSSGFSAISLAPESATSITTPPRPTSTPATFIHVIGKCRNTAASIIVKSGVSELITDESTGLVSPMPSMKSPWLALMISSEHSSRRHQSRRSIGCRVSIEGGSSHENMRYSSAPPVMRMPESPNGVMAPLSSTDFDTGDITPQPIFAKSIARCAPNTSLLPGFIPVVVLSLRVQN